MLKKKIIGILLLLMAAMSAMDSAIHRWVIYPQFIRMERAQAEKDMARCVAALNAEIHSLDAFAHDWADWDDTCRFVSEKNSAFIDSNLGAQTFIDNRLGLVAIYDLSGTRVWARGVDPHTGDTAEISPFNLESLPATHPLIDRSDTDKPVKGLFLTDKGPMLVASRQIHTSEHGGPARGYLVTGRFLSGGLIGELAARVQVDHWMWALASEALPEEDRESARQIRFPSAVHIQERGDRLSVYRVLPDISGADALLVKADIPREFSSGGLAAIRYAIVSDVIVTVIIVGVLFILLERTVVNPLSLLTKQAGVLEANGDFSIERLGERKDEIGFLCREFERMVRRLQRTHRGLRDKIEEHRRSQEMLGSYHSKLRQLSSKLLLVEEDERRRIAIDLHDRIGQSLTVSKMWLDALLMGQPEGKDTQKIRDIGELLEKTIADTRLLTFELSPPVLYEFGLIAALEWLSEKFSREHHLRIQIYSMVDALPMDTHLRVLLFQATRELLFNIVKHAHAKGVKIHIEMEGSSVKITIEDDGVGFDAAASAPAVETDPGFGIFSIKERLRFIGGRMEIESRFRVGTCVTLVCPLSSTPIESGRT